MRTWLAGGWLGHGRPARRLAAAVLAAGGATTTTNTTTNNNAAAAAAPAPRQYAYVIHTTNPTNGDAGEIYCELVLGLGEAIVSGTVPGAALTFVARKDDMDNPRVLLYPSKSEGMFVDESLIFRSDSNGEDLEGYAGAGAGAAGRSSGGWRSGLCAAVFSARPLRWSAGRLPGHTPSHTSLSPLPSHTPVPPPPPPPHPYRRPVRLCDHRHHCAPQGRLLLRPAHDRPRVPGAPHAGHLPRGAGHRAGAGVGAGGREGRVCVWAGGPGGSRAPH